MSLRVATGASWLPQAELLEEEQRTVAASKERILRLQEEVEALSSQLVDANSSLAAFKVCVCGEHQVLTRWAASLAEANYRHLIQLCPRTLADPLQQPSRKTVAECSQVS